MTGPATPGEVPLWLRALLRTMHEQIRSAVRADLASKKKEFLASEARVEADDSIFQIDIKPEKIVQESFHGTPEAVVVICEGLSQSVFPEGATEDAAAWWIIIDPLDGSREISYNKRSAWVLSGVAPAGPAPTLADIVWAIQTEVPVTAQPTGAILTAVKGQRTVLESCDLATGVATAVEGGLRPSTAASVSGGFAVFADYFAGSHAVTARIADLVFDAVLKQVQPGKALAFNDQYLSTAGCMYLLANGTYRFFADLRPVVGRVAARSHRNVGLCAHPYDLCTYLIAEQAAVVAEQAAVKVHITDPTGATLAYPLATNVDCGWVGYANQSIRDEMEDPLHAAIAAVEQAEPT